ncbi:hypothetical protein CF336_g5835 [Tilletia laevis]|uniref:Uncharacterized protein n=1 Tax=Tilletia caries TaxID=13290 RepID=A0A177UUN9_9BASI|nr:hypothetical protein CF336_g5835 [Tilletia laevis]KAE8195455.1 hypothetical protein CF335_g5096 [Tilletia laevis]KAE8256748.1 hypothetical protein A4X03_0g5096 [Tilletia caries]
MDIYTRFDLPPPPPPTVYSRDHTDARARMPNFTSVEEVSDFVDAARLWRHNSAANGFFIFATAYLLLMAVLAVAGICHKLYKRSFWVFRVVPRGHSKIIIPNIHTSFVLFITPFLLLLAASAISLIVGHDRNEPNVHFGVWIAAVGVPVYFSVWYQSWGIIAARLGDGSISSRKANDRSRARLAPAWLVNAVWLFLPAMPSVACLVIASVADSYYEQARHGWFEWHSQYDGMPELTRDMVLDAQNIFHASIHGTYHLSVILTVWTVVCLTNTVFHCYTTTTLIYGIRKHIGSKRRGMPLQSFKAVSQPAVPSPNSLANTPLEKIDEIDSSFPSHATSTASPRPAVSFSRDTGNQRDGPGQITSRMFTSVERAQNRSISFFPSITPSTTVVCLEASKATVIVAFFALQSMSITFGGLAFTANFLYMIVKYYAATEANNFQPYWLISYSLVLAITILAGTGSVVSLVHTTFEDSVAMLVDALRLSTVGEEEMYSTNFLDLEETRELEAL